MDSNDTFHELMGKDGSRINWHHHQSQAVDCSRTGCKLMNETWGYKISMRFNLLLRKEMSSCPNVVFPLAKCNN